MYTYVYFGYGSHIFSSLLTNVVCPVSVGLCRSSQYFTILDLTRMVVLCPGANRQNKYRRGPVIDKCGHKSVDMDGGGASTYFIKENKTFY